jgi:hypothetical protein
MVTYVLKGTNKLKDKVAILVPVNHMYCMHQTIACGVAVNVSVEDLTDIRASHGTVGIMEKKGYLTVEQVAAVEPAKVAAKPQVEEPAKVVEQPKQEAKVDSSEYRKNRKDKD